MSASTTVDFLLVLLIVACTVGLIAMRLRIPYTVALVLGGLALGIWHSDSLQTISREWFTPDVILVLFLPALLFEGSLRIDVRQLRKSLVPILILANVGVLIATLITGYALRWSEGLPLLVTLLFGAIISSTDPISVLALFRELSVPKGLSLIVETESLANNGTAVVLFQILLAGVITGKLPIATGVVQFVVSVAGGSLIGLVLGYLMDFVTMSIDDPQIEITLTAILAYGSYVLANQLHVSGVLATVAAGITVGNVSAKTAMSPRTLVALFSFWEFLAFVINSLVFLLIGIEVHVGELFRQRTPILLAVVAVLLGRAVSVYGLVHVSNWFSEKISLRWQHILVWGGLRGSLSLALALSLAPTFPYRQQILAFTFGVVAFSIIIQGLTLKPLLRALKITPSDGKDATLAYAEQIALSSAMAELDKLFRAREISLPVYAVLQGELRGRHRVAPGQIGRLDSQLVGKAAAEVRVAQRQIGDAVRRSIEHATHSGTITAEAAAQIIDSTEQQLNRLYPNNKQAEEAG